MGAKWERTAKLYWGDKTLPRPAEESLQEREHRERELLESRRRRELAPAGIYAALLKAGVGERIARLIADGEIEEDSIPRAVRDFAERFPKHGGGGLLLCGPPGVGKSTTAAWLLCRYHVAVVAAMRLSDREGTTPNGWRVRSADLFAAIFAKRSEVLQRCRSAPMLVIDDFGAVYEHEWPLGEVDALVDYRYERERSTIATTNLWPHRKDAGEQSFEARYPRIWSRLLDGSGPGLVTLRGADRRRGGPRTA